MNENFRLIRQPSITEKSALLKEAENMIVLEVATEATKPQIKEAVEKVFKVKVKNVNTVKLKGKMKRRGRFQGRKPDRKKAYITLTADSKAPDFFEAT